MKKNFVLMALSMFFSVVFSVKFAQAYFDNETVPYATTGKEIDSMKIIQELPKTLGIARLGVKKGDIVLKVDDVQIVNRHTGFQAYTAKNPKTVTVLRNNKQIVLGSE